MNTYLKTVLMFGAIAGLYVPATARADFYDYNYKVGPQLGRGSSQSARRSRPMNRSTAPVIVRTELAPNAVAQAPSDERSYSYEPSQQAVSGGCSCEDNVATEKAPATAQRSTDTGRSFSYEPSMSDSYSTPRMRSRSSDRPTYLLPKGDPNRYRVN
jgi:hypothetical protein